MGLLAASAFIEAAEAAPLARYFPKQDLAVYAEFDGLDTHGELWRKTAAYRLLNETPTGAMLESVLVQLAGRIRPSSTMTLPEVGEMRILAEHAIRHGFAVGVVRNHGQPRPFWVGVVIRGGGKGKVREVVEKCLASARNPDEKPQSVGKPKGRTLSIEGGTEPQAAWWQEGDDIALSLLSPEGADVMIEALDGGRPDATGHPERVALARSPMASPRSAWPSPISPPFPNCLPRPSRSVSTGSSRSNTAGGFKGMALMTVTRLVAPAPRSGLLALFDQPTFDRESLASLPPGLAGVTAFSVDLGGVYDRFVAGLAATNPMARTSFESSEIAFRNVTGLRIRDDLLAQLGSKVTYFSLPTRGDAPSHVVAGLAQGFLRTPRYVAILEVKDPAAFAKMLDGAVSKTQAYFRDRFEANTKPPPVRIHPLKGIAHGYSVSISPSVAPLPAGFRPTFIMGKKSLIFASNPEDARATLELQERGAPLPASDPLALPLSRLPRRAIMASVIDERRSLLPELIANLPLLVQWGQTFVGGRFNGPQFRQPQQGRPGILMPMQGSVAGLEIDPDKIPTPEELRPFLFPSVFTLTADDQAVEYTTREAFPALNPVALAPVAVGMLLPASQSARVRRAAKPIGEQPQADRPRDAQLPLHTRLLPAAGHLRQEEETAVELAGGAPPLPGGGRALQRVQARRALGQSAQQGPHPADAEGLRHPRRQGRAGQDVLSRFLRPVDIVRSQAKGRGGRRTPRYHRRNLKHARCRGGEGGRHLDQAGGGDPVRRERRSGQRQEIARLAWEDTSRAASTHSSSTGRFASSKRRSTPWF